MKSLSQHLKPYSRDDLLDIAERAGVTPRIAVDARGGNRINADGYLRLCNATGFDPVTGEKIKPSVLGGFNFNHLARDVRFKRALDKQRTVAKEMGIPTPAVCRVEKAYVTCIETVLKACAYVGEHPFHYMHAENVSRATSTEIRTYEAA